MKKIVLSSSFFLILILSGCDNQFEKHTNYIQENVNIIESEQKNKPFTDEEFEARQKKSEDLAKLSLQIKPGKKDANTPTIDYGEIEIKEENKKLLERVVEASYKKELEILGDKNILERVELSEEDYLDAFKNFTKEMTHIITTKDVLVSKWEIQLNYLAKDLGVIYKFDEATLRKISEDKSPVIDQRKLTNLGILNRWLGVGGAVLNTVDKNVVEKELINKELEAARKSVAVIVDALVQERKTEDIKIEFLEDKGSGHNKNQDNLKDCVIKGNISYNTGEKIYHFPGCDYYSSTVIDEKYGEKWFCTEQEAINAGWRKAYNCP
ncbi:MAG TPA: hypothetical protein PKL13_04020 [bacterium]|nr:hypothetical protein [bacterium]